MPEANDSNCESMLSIRHRLLAAALPDVAFDGWCEEIFERGAERCGIDPMLARAACPRGHLDLAATFHRQGDDDMCRLLLERDHSHFRYSEKVAAAIMARFETVEDSKDAVRRGMALYSLPHLALKAPGSSGARRIESGRRWAIIPTISTGIRSAQFFRRFMLPHC